MKKYCPSEISEWKGRVDGLDDPSSLRMHQVVRPLDLSASQIEVSQGLNIAFLGFCSDEGVKRNKGRVGASMGPQAIRKAMANLPAHFQDRLGIYDAGDIFCDDGNLEESQQTLADAIKTLLKNHICPIVLGGGHDVAFGHGMGVYNSIDKPLGIFNFDAHFDLRPVEDGLGTSGTPFLQLAESCKKNGWPFHYYCLGLQKSSNTKNLFDRASLLDVKYVMRDDMQLTNSVPLQNQLSDYLSQVEAIYLTVCLDVFASAYAPGVSAPAAFGITPSEFLLAFRQILRSGKVVSFDIAEMSPPHDQDGRTAKLAAQIVFEFLEHFQPKG